MKEFTCIVCPNGCHLSINEETLEVSGNKCKRGEEFAKQELTHPERTICSTVRTIFSDCPVLPCKVSNVIPKDKIFDVMKEINKVVLDKRIGRGEVIIKNVLGLGVDIISTSNKLRKE